MALEGMPIVSHLCLTFVLGDDGSSNVGRSNTREGIEARDRCCLIQPMIMWQVSCKSVLTSLRKQDRLQLEQAYWGEAQCRGSGTDCCCICTAL